MQHCARAPAHTDVPCFQHFKRHQGRACEIPQLVSEKAELFKIRRLVIVVECFPSTAKLCHGAGNRIV
jgi:hypothetical protein